MSQFKPREAYAGRKESGTAMEFLWRGFLSLRDPAGPTYRSVPSHVAGPPADFPARPPLTDAPGRVFRRPIGVATVVGFVKTRPTLPLCVSQLDSGDSEAARTLHPPELRSLQPRPPGRACASHALNRAPSPVTFSGFGTTSAEIHRDESAPWRAAIRYTPGY